MTPKTMHRSRGKAARVREPDDARAESEVALAAEAEPAALRLNQPLSPQVPPRGGEQSQRGTMPSVPKSEKAGKEGPPESFDALAAHLNARFGQLAADIEQLRQGLRAAEEQSEQLRRKLLTNRALRG